MRRNPKKKEKCRLFALFVGRVTSQRLLHPSKGRRTPQMGSRRIILGSDAPAKQ